jgi:membrane protein insertase Oxa1/YidC/SpoIIIJ
MKRKFGYWFSLAFGAGAFLGICVSNLPAGMALGFISGLLLALVQTSFIKNGYHEQDL